MAISTSAQQSQAVILMLYLKSEVPYCSISTQESLSNLLYESYSLDPQILYKLFPPVKGMFMRIVISLYQYSQYYTHCHINLISTITDD